MEANITSFFRKLEDDETRPGIEDTNDCSNNLYL